MCGTVRAQCRPTSSSSRGTRRSWSGECVSASDVTSVMIVFGSPDPENPISTDACPCRTARFPSGRARRPHRTGQGRPGTASTADSGCGAQTTAGRCRACARRGSPRLPKVSGRAVCADDGRGADGPRGGERGRTVRLGDVHRIGDSVERLEVVRLVRHRSNAPAACADVVGQPVRARAELVWVGRGVSPGLGAQAVVRVAVESVADGVPACSSAFISRLGILCPSDSRRCRVRVDLEPGVVGWVFTMTLWAGQWLASPVHRDWGSSRCSILFHSRSRGGRWHTLISSRSRRRARPARSFHNWVRPPLEPPPSAQIRAVPRPGRRPCRRCPTSGGWPERRTARCRGRRPRCHPAGVGRHVVAAVRDGLAEALVRRSRARPPARARRRAAIPGHRSLPPDQLLLLAVHAITGSPRPCAPPPRVEVAADWASRSGCCLPSIVLASPCRLYPAHGSARWPRSRPTPDVPARPAPRTGSGSTWSSISAEHRIAPGLRLHQRLQCLKQTRMVSTSGRRPAPGRRIRPSCGSADWTFPPATVLTVLRVRPGRLGDPLGPGLGPGPQPRPPAPAAAPSHPGAAGPARTCALHPISRHKPHSTNQASAAARNPAD